MRLALLLVPPLAVLALACAAGATEYQVIVRFNSTVTQSDMDDVAAYLRTYDSDVDSVLRGEQKFCGIHGNPSKRYQVGAKVSKDLPY